MCQKKETQHLKGDGEAKRTRFQKKKKVYKINCNDFEMFYIRQAKRFIMPRFQEHIEEISKGKDDGAIIDSYARHRGGPFYEKTKSGGGTTSDALDIWKSFEILLKNAIKVMNPDEGNCASRIIKELADKYRDRITQ